MHIEGIEEYVMPESEEEFCLEFPNGDEDDDGESSSFSAFLIATDE